MRLLICGWSRIGQVSIQKTSFDFCYRCFHLQTEGRSCRPTIFVNCSPCYSGDRRYVNRGYNSSTTSCSCSNGNRILNIGPYLPVILHIKEALLYGPQCSKPIDRPQNGSDMSTHNYTQEITHNRLFSDLSVEKNNLQAVSWIIIKTVDQVHDRPILHY